MAGKHFPSRITVDELNSSYREMLGIAKDFCDAAAALKKAGASEMWVFHRASFDSEDGGLKRVRAFASSLHEATQRFVAGNPISETEEKSRTAKKKTQPANPTRAKRTKDDPSPDDAAVRSIVSALGGNSKDVAAKLAKLVESIRAMKS